MRKNLVATCFILCIRAEAQIPKHFIGEWHFFSENGRYVEVSITDSFIYYYNYLRTPAKWRYSVIENSIVFERDSLPDYSYRWSFNPENDSVLIINETDVTRTRFYRKNKEASTVIDLYNKTNGDYKPEIFSFEKEALIRRKQLELLRDSL